MAVPRTGVALLTPQPLWCVAFCVLCLVAGRERQLYDAENHIEACRMYGNIDVYAYYYVDLLVGTPPQRVSVIADTGSGVTAFPCTGCTHCGFDHHIDPAFSFDKSDSADWMPCGGSCHGGCKTVSGVSHCTYYQGYTEGSSISGFWFQDMVSLGDMLQHNPPVRGSMGCHRNENKLFYNQSANGIMGIGPRGRNGRTLLQELFRDLNASVFSMCLAEWGGLLVVGGHNETYHTGELQYVTLDTRSGYYRVPLTGMRVDGHSIGNFGTTMIDSGTTFTYMKTSAYNSLRGGIEAYCRGTGCGGARKVEHAPTCYQLPLADAGLEQFPTVDVVFDNRITTAWEPKSYLYRKSDKRYPANTWCYTFEDDGAHANTVLGAAWMRHKEVIFDVQAMRVGIVRSDCPNFRERPAPPGGATTTTATTTTTAVPNWSAEGGLRGSNSTSSASTRTTTRTTSTTSTVATTTTRTTTSTTRPATTTATTSTSTLWRAQERIAQTVEGQDAQGGGASSRSPSVFGDAIGSLLAARPLLLLGVVAGLALAVALACLARRLCKKRKFEYEKQKDQDAHEREDLTSGMPPQIVGVPTGDEVGADAFVIGDDDDDVDDLDEEGLAQETDNFAYGQIRTDLRPQPNARRSAEETDGDKKEAAGAPGRSPPDGGSADGVSYFGPNGVDPFGGDDGEQDDRQFWQSSSETAYQPPAFVASGSSNGGGGREGEGAVNGQLL